MKTKKYFFTVLGFFAGIVFGVSIIGLYSFSNGPASEASGSGVVAVSADIAKSYCRNYLADATPMTQVIKGFTIDKVQLDAMNLIAKENPQLAGFRIYIGKDNTTKKIAIVVGVDNLGVDAVKNTIYTTDSQKLSPCPPICDVSSPILLDK